MGPGPHTNAVMQHVLCVTILVAFYLCDKYCPQTDLGERVYFSFSIPGHRAPRKGEAGTGGRNWRQELETGTGGRDHRETLLTGLLLVLFLLS